MSDQKSAVITGAAMGMGALKAKTLAERGWRVFAGVLPGADTSELGDNPNITKVEQDVTSTDSVNASAETVSKALDGKGLDLLINNAGIANVGIGVIEGFDMDRGKFMFEVNTWGPIRICQAFLPMIRQNAPHSRIINFASGAVRANPPASGVYNMSKHAVVGLTKTLRHELSAFGIQVTSIEPGAVKTHMTADAGSTTQNIWKEVSQEMNDVYGPHLKYTTTEHMTELLANANEPQVIVNEVLSLLDKKKWKPSYLVGKDAKPLGWMSKLLPDRTMESLIQKGTKIPQYKG